MDDSSSSIDLASGEKKSAGQTRPSGDLPTEKGSASAKTGSQKAKVSWASPRFWHGMRFSTYVTMLWRGGFRIHFLAWGMTIAVLIYSVMNSLFSFIQWLLLGRRIEETKFERPPVFVVGHWRSGTTLVHELMDQNDELVAPSTYQCFAPSHFLITEWLLKPIVQLVMPKTRPMDNMATGADLPNEDEFAICALGGPSPYFAMAFPNQEPPHQDTIDMVNVSAEDRESLRKTILQFTKSLTYKKKGKRLLLKSPTHTGRIEFLRELFPGAKFIHISRDPKDVIPSTIRLWNRLNQVNGFQIPREEPEEQEIRAGKTFQKMYRAYLSDTESQKDDLIELKYEDIVADPVTTLGRAFKELELEGFENMRPRLIEYMERQSDYQRNKHQMTDRLKGVINEYCGEYRKRFGYEAN